MISIVLPIYNEEKNIKKCIEDISNFFCKKPLPFEIILVNDGSTDKTKDILDGYKDKANITVVSHPKNLGYGSALRSGFNKAQGDLIFFTDSDCQFNIADINSFLEEIKNYDFVIGYRKDRKDAKIRIFYGLLLRLISKFLFFINIKDVNCAFKLFKKEVIKSLPLSEDGALINLEILSLAKQQRYNFLELPVNHLPRISGKQTGGSFKVIFRSVYNFFNLWSKVSLKDKKFATLAGIAIFLFTCFVFFIYRSHIYFNLDILNRWDTVHYLYLAEHGYCNLNCLYDYERFSIVFFPLYPFLIKILQLLTKNYILSSIIISNIFYVLTIYFLYKLVKKDFSQEIALKTVLLISAFPTAYFFHIGYTESLFVFLVVASFYSARSRKWLSASMFGMLACLTRINGIILLPAFLIEYFSNKEKSIIKKDILFIALMPLGSLLYLFINYAVYHNPLQFMIFMKEHWYKTFTLPTQGFMVALNGIHWQPFNKWLATGAMEMLFATFALAVILFSFKKIRLSYFVYSALNLVLITFSSFWLSIPRYVIAIFPIFIALALATKRPLAFYIMMSLFLTGQIVFLTLFLTGIGGY